jgi:anti-anti-sigma factor
LWNRRRLGIRFPIPNSVSVRSASTQSSGTSVTLGSADILSDALTAIESAGADPLIIDMAQVRFLDCSGLSVLLGAYNRACRDDRDLFITNPQPAVRRIFTLTGCKHLLNGSARQEAEVVKAPA